MLGEDVIDVTLQLGAEERRQLVGVVQAVAPAECRLFGKLGERHESLGPAGVAKAATCRSHRQALDDAVCRAMDEGGKLPVPPGQKAGHVFAVTPEQLVRAHPRQKDLDPGLTGPLRHEKGVDGGRIAGGFVEDVDHPRQQVDHVWPELDLMQFDPVALRDLPGVDGVIRHGFEPMVLVPERNGVGVDLGIGLLRQHGHDARVEPAGEEARHRDVCDEVGVHRVFDDLPEVVTPGLRSLASSTMSQYRSTRQVPSGRNSAQVPGWSFSTPSMEHIWSGTQ